MASVPEPGSADGRVPDGRERRGDVSYRLLREAILRGELAPGVRLHEAALADWCGVSRTPLREALRRLVHDGLVVEDGQGRAVRTSDSEDLRGRYEVRIQLESAAACWAAARRTEFDLARIEAAHRWAAEVDDADTMSVAGRHRAFHRALWRAAHNPTLAHLLESITLGAGRYPGTTTGRAGRREDSLREHAGLASAIAARDGDRAAWLVRRHLEAALEIAVGR